MTTIELEQDIKELIMPENLKIGMMVNKKRKENNEGAGEGTYYNYVLGQSPFHAPKTLRDALGKHADKNEYGPAQGMSELLQSVSDWNNRHFDINVKPERIIIGTGTKMIMYMLLKMLKDHVFLPTPSWIGYPPLLDYLEKPYTKLRMRSEDDFALNPEMLDKHFSEVSGPKILILNNPHNPTGTVYKEDALKEIVKVCKKHDVTVIADEIYALMTHDLDDFTSMAKLYPEKSFVTNGLSKDRSAAGYRLGTCILPTTNTEELREVFVRFASTLYTNVATPIQYAAHESYKKGASIEHYMDTTREIHGLIGKHLSNYASQIDGLKVSKTEGGFYFVVDFNAYKDVFNKNGIHSSTDLMYKLLESPYHIALVTGNSIGLSQDDYMARIAFVDYDGEKVYKAYEKEKPSTDEEKETFVKKHMHHMFVSVKPAVPIILSKSIV